MTETANLMPDPDALRARLDEIDQAIEGLRDERAALAARREALDAERKAVLRVLHAIQGRAKKGAKDADNA